MPAAKSNPWRKTPWTPACRLLQSANRGNAMEGMLMKHPMLVVCVAGAVAIGAATFAFAQVVPNVQGGQAAQLQRVPVSGLHIGKPSQLKNPDAGNPQALMEGKKLFNSLNCAGCHAPGGGGGMGPSLSDKVWIYGGSPGDIYLSILHGRPNGMPQWGTVLPPQAIWALVTYVQTLSQPNPQFEPTTKPGAQPAPGSQPSPPQPPATKQPPPNPSSKVTPAMTHPRPSTPPKQQKPAQPTPKPATSSTSGQP